MTKSFIDLSSMHDMLLTQLKEKFESTTSYNTNNITISLSLADIVEKTITERQIKEPKIYILDTAWLKIAKLLKENSKEVGWHCLVEQYPDNRYVIYDVLVFPQKVTGVTTTGVDGKYEMWLATLPDEQFNHLRCHMHSHVNMGVTPSGVDETYYANLMTQVQDYYIIMIANKSHDYHLRFYDKINNIVYDNITFEMINAAGETYDAWFDSVKDMVEDNTPAATVWDYDASKKKVQSTTCTRTKSSGKNTIANEVSILSTPDNKLVQVKDINEATNCIYTYYEKQNKIKDYKKFTRNHIRTRLAKENMVCIHPKTLAFVDGASHNEKTLGFAIRYTDIWEIEE